MSTVCTNDQVESYRNLGCALLVMPEGIILRWILRVVSLCVTLLFKPSSLRVKVRACQLVVEVQRDVGQLF